jgi:hypothetical protein
MKIKTNEATQDYVEVFQQWIHSAEQFDGNFYELAQAVLLLAEKLNVEFVRTNATKHGNVVIKIREL